MQIYQEYIPQVITTAIILFLNPVTKYMLRKLVFSFGRAGLKNERRIGHMARIVGMIINVFCLILIAVVWGVTPSSIMPVLSAVFAVIGVALFAQWSILSNITAGIIIFFTTPFRIGDDISIMDKDMAIEATIENIYTFHIHLRTRDGLLVIVANNIFLQKMVSMDKQES